MKALLFLETFQIWNEETMVQYHCDGPMSVPLWWPTVCAIAMDQCLYHGYEPLFLPLSVPLLENIVCAIMITL